MTSGRAVTSGLVVTARPRRTAILARVLAALILAVFVFTALVMRQRNAGADFVTADQFGTAVVGVILALVALLPTRPRLRADADGVRLRAFLGSERVVGWEIINRVEFPKKLRFARIVLPGEETLALYAVQRWDHDQSVRVMKGLRELFAAAKATTD